MRILTRRQSLVGVAAAMAAGPSRAQAVRIRHDVDSVEGRAMLAKYARAVARMSAPTTAATSPRSWIYQWYIHAVPRTPLGAPGKGPELNRIFGAGPSPAKTLANQVWQTCESHFSADDDMFLPWHRLYLMAFEDIVRAVLNDQDFTLPYWDYTRDGGRSLPEPFRLPGDDQYGTLYRQNRRKDDIDINGGDPIDKGFPVSPFNLEVLSNPDYTGPGGFCVSLDLSLHGGVHVQVGDATNMGDVPTAAGDPIFWLHHCNIDRLWAAWNEKAHGANPTISRPYRFASPSGTARVMQVSQAWGLASAGYRYDRLPDPPAGPATAAVAAVGELTLAASEQPRTVLGAGPTKIPLKGAASTGEISAATAASGPGRLVVVIEGLETTVTPGALYQVYVDLPDGADEQTRKRHYVGAFNFFGVGGEHSHRARPVTLDATATVRNLAASNRLSASPVVTVIPAAPPRAGANPSVGPISLVRK